MSLKGFVDLSPEDISPLDCSPNTDLSETSTAEIPRKHFPRSILADTHDILVADSATSSRGCYEDVARVGRVGRLPCSACRALT